MKHCRRWAEGFTGCSGDKLAHAVARERDGVDSIVRRVARYSRPEDRVYTVARRASVECVAAVETVAARDV